MGNYTFTVVIEPDGQGYHAYVPSLPGCHTFGETVDEARANISEAIELHVKSMLADGECVPVEREPLFSAPYAPYCEMRTSAQRNCASFYSTWSRSLGFSCRG